MKKTLLALTLNLALALTLQAQEAAKPDTQKDCEQILQAYATVQVAAGQADLVSQVQKGMVVICKRAIEAEKKVPVEIPKEEEKK